MGVRAIIFGANGYIGKHLTDYLNLLNWNLTCYDTQTDSIFSNAVKISFEVSGMMGLR